MISFKALQERTRGGGAYNPPGNLLCIDPGHTTGWCTFNAQYEIEAWGQAMTVINRKGNNEGDINWEAVRNLIIPEECDWPDCVVCEDYRVYAHKLDRHTNSQVLTLRIIGAIEFLCWANDIPIYYQMAATAKGFADDKKLKEWGFWKDGMRHSRDAIRHGCYFLLFNKQWQKQQ